MKPVAEEYSKLSEEVKTVKARIIAIFVELHKELCRLARLERKMANVRMRGGKDVIPALEAHIRQVQIPTLQIWSGIDFAMSLIYQHTQDSRAELPGLFAESNRIQYFLKDEE